MGEPFGRVARERHARRNAKDDVLSRLASLAKSKFSLKLCFNIRLKALRMLSTVLWPVQWGVGGGVGGLEANSHTFC